MAPLKALCTEKFSEWSEKFENDLNLKCIELTGDTDNDDENDLSYVENANIICTTPVRFGLFFFKFNLRILNMKGEHYFPKNFAIKRFLS